jgi:Protein of unknown function (DUF3761)
MISTRRIQGGRVTLVVKISSPMKLILSTLIFVVTAIYAAQADYISCEPSKEIRGYINCDGQCVAVPQDSGRVPNDAPSGVCVDGRPTFSRHSQGACSHHGGIARWIDKPPPATCRN